MSVDLVADGKNKGKKMAEITESEKKKEDWMNSKWRPMMGWMYMAVCSFDFVLAPILWSLVQSLAHGSVQTQWQPLTLQGAGLFHVAMGAVLGIAAMGRTQEKLAGANNGGIGTTYTPPAASATPAPSFGAPAAPSFSAPSFSAPAPAAPTPIKPTISAAPINTSTGFGGGFGSGLDANDPPARNTRNDG
jgi:hypothetical protein